MIIDPSVVGIHIRVFLAFGESISESEFLSDPLSCSFSSRSISLPERSG